MKIQSSDKTIHEILQSHYYKIPSFQRPYSWDNDRVDEFWEDTIKSDASEYFIGSMVVYDDSTGIRGVVDGQQRLTTITLILAALRNIFLREGFSEQSEGLHRFIEKADLNNNVQYVIQPETSYPYFQEYIQKKTSPSIVAEIGSEEKKLEAAFNRLTRYILETITPIKDAKNLDSVTKIDRVQKSLEYIRDSILDLKVIIIDLDKEDEAYTVFETLNTRGMDLQVEDLFKSYLAQLLKTENKNVDITRDKWTKIKNNINYDKNNPKGQTSTLKDFLYDYWLINYNYTSTKKLYKELKKEVTEHNASEFLDNLLSASEIYKFIFTPSVRTWQAQDENISKALNSYHIFRVKQHMPMVLALFLEYNEKNITKKMLKKALVSLEKFFFIFTAIVSERANKAPKKFYAKYARDLLSEKDKSKKGIIINDFIDDLRSRIPTEDDFKLGFLGLKHSNSYTRQKDLIHYILSKIDKHHQKSLNVDYISMSIEHIASQKPEDTSKPLETVGSIGNLILVSSEYNAKELANKPYSEKKPLLLTSKMWIDEIIKQNNEWTESTIEQRTKILSELAYNNIWKF